MSEARQVAAGPVTQQGSHQGGRDVRGPLDIYVYIYIYMSARVCTYVNIYIYIYTFRDRGEHMAFEAWGYGSKYISDYPTMKYVGTRQ